MNWYYIDTRLYIYHDKWLYMTLCVHFMMLIGYILMFEMLKVWHAGKESP